MGDCLLCFQNITESSNYIPALSSQWNQFQITNIIEKHFWPMESVDGICQRCWSHLYEFHQFYRAVEDAHLNAIQMDNKHQTFHNFEQKLNANNSLGMETALTSPCILKVESLSNDALMGTNDEIITDSYYIEEIETVNTAKPKKKRGRPRKIHALNGVVQLKKPKGKVGRPRKKFKQITELVSANQSTKLKGSNVKKIYAMDPLAGTNKKPKGKVGRPRKYFREINDLPSTSHSTTRNGSIVNENEAIGQLSDTDNIASLKPRKKGRPFKKKRNRPHKVQVNEGINISFSTVEDEIPLEESAIDPKIPMVQLHADNCMVHSDDLLNDVPLNDNGLRKTKELDLKNIFKKRQRIKQHKAQMRNYIATSVRCMKFVKN